MKTLLTSLTLFISALLYAQVPSYYSSIDWNQTGAVLQSSLTNLITTTHNEITYAECWDVLKVSDLETGSSTHVLLVYGSDDGDGNVMTDRTRLKDNNGGTNGQWNREHIFPKSLGNPDLGTTGPGSDAHNLRASDVQQNGNRANKKYTDGSGIAANTAGEWYPGDEWKGDCARVIMYMYLRYENRCLPSSVGVGSLNSSDQNMVNTFLEWNADDPVSQFERDRNDGIYTNQGNRNPFIDNPRIAYQIWGGPIPEDPWGVLNAEENPLIQELLIYPMPVTGNEFFISGLNTTEVNGIEFFDVSGSLVRQLSSEEIAGGISVDGFANGTYFLSIIFDQATLRKKIIIQ